MSGPPSRPAESARIVGSAMAGMKVPDGIPPRIAARIELFKDVDAEAHLPYLAALRERLWSPHPSRRDRRHPYEKGFGHLIRPGVTVAMDEERGRDTEPLG